MFEIAVFPEYEILIFSETVTRFMMVIKIQRVISRCIKNVFTENEMKKYNIFTVISFRSLKYVSVNNYEL